MAILHRSSFIVTAALLFTLALVVCSRQRSDADDLSTPLLGSWRQLNDCSRPDFVFNKDDILMNTDVDGEAVQFSFHKVIYSRSPTSPDLIIVDFIKPHGLAGARSDHSLEVKIINQNKIMFLMRRADFNVILTRCPRE